MDMKSCVIKGLRDRDRMPARYLEGHYSLLYFLRKEECLVSR